WAVVTLLGVLVAVASGAAFMASRSVARTPATPTAEVSVAAASGSEVRTTKPASARPALETRPMVERTSGTSEGTLAAVRGEERADDHQAPSSNAAVAEEDDAPVEEARERRASRRPVL